MSTAPGTGPRVAIACQGGGSHTAFTAGVLARLLRDPALDDREIVGISGTSGGAACAIVAWDRLRHGDRTGAADALEAFWDDNAARSPLERLQNAGLVTAGTLQGLGLIPAGTPYLVPRPFDGTRQFRDLVERHVDFGPTGEIAPRPDGPLLLLGAVDVLTGAFRAFSSRTDAISSETVLASSAIPAAFRAVHTAGGVYWDGLFSQNPPIRDLLDALPDELWGVQVVPAEIDTEPRTPLEITVRRDGLSGNLSLHQELGFVETIDRLLADGALRDDAGYRQVRVRVVELPGPIPSSRLFGSASAIDRDAAFLERLELMGHDQAGRFLAVLTFERALREHDAGALRAALAPGATLRSSAPFPVRTGVPLAGHADELLDEVTVDPALRQRTGEGAVWAVRGPGGVPGRADAELDDAGRVTELTLGPPR
ncbi:patatin-like phospholipase family protein [Pseudonocardia phyllosphaerae]|uniref:patatin-like phospholipase family protein n=1 Tax=Pseudonocardia phyllosphaerae TaxID=3390502 RepID=UPI00397ACE5B